MKLDFNFDILNLKNESMGKKASELLADNLVAIQSKNIKVLKAYEFAKKLMAENFINADKEDANKLKDFLNDESSFIPLVKAQILGVVIDALNAKDGE